MKKEISVLVPVYNKSCTKLIKSLSEQLRKIKNIEYEILIADDGSTNSSITNNNKLKINGIEHCKYIIRKENVGRAAIRNFLGQTAKYRWLLFLDCDVDIDEPHFIETYLKTSSEFKVVYGGVKICIGKQDITGNLRYSYEKRYELKHTATKRSKKPYQAFRTTNFLIEKNIFNKILFDSKITTYGYEDVMFGKELYNHKIKILHIDNGVKYIEYDDNLTFIRKIEESLYTLDTMKETLRNYSGILHIYNILTILHLRKICQTIFKINKNKWRNNLLSANPSLFIFNLYRIGYFISIHKHP